MSAAARLLEIPDMNSAGWCEYAEAQGWGDGLPTLAPTGESVDTYLAAAGPCGPTVGPVPPSGVIPDVRSLAANAVMAGCPPSAFPIVVASLRAVLADGFNLVGVMATTHPCTPLVIVSGSARKAAGVTAKHNCLGQGWRAHATIGLAAEGPHKVNDHGSTTGAELWVTIAGTMATPGSNNFYLGGEHIVVLGPEPAATLARDGWDIAGMQQQLHELARVPQAVVSAGKRAELAARSIEAANGHYRMAGGPES